MFKSTSQLYFCITGMAMVLSRSFTQTCESKLASTFTSLLQSNFSSPHYLTLHKTFIYRKSLLGRGGVPDKDEERGHLFYLQNATLLYILL